MLALFSLKYHHTHIKYCVIAQYGVKKLTQKMRPFRAEFFVFKLFTYHIAPEPVLYMCVFDTFQGNRQLGIYFFSVK